MKPIIVYILLITSVRQYAQQIKGIYLTSNDFITGKLFFIKEKGKDKIKLHDFIYKPFITVKHNHYTYRILKDTLYGYEDRKNRIYRFFEKKAYLMLNPKESILLYSIKTKTAEFKYSKTITTYYFSKNPQSSIIPLTIGNLITSYSDNKLFIEYITLYFKTNSELSEYDFTHHQYKLNRLLELSTQH